ncbi:DUF1440 domain-containing protein [Spirosoma sp. KCTC 42546]|uniref:DUF1440 domain-containing protein n=1 Tax=Spirosoma sp. KCTC 42546 TaxID=2520506 RepID=UPI001159FA85|nr:DUF1440 domain-containing protein [Spirosoma sp. KCTC 42546]QDK78519.1 DUF1440 domain-containing protein [Spirosoma sp. KCTC 42546]
MNQPASSSAVNKSVRTIIYAGLVAGLLDAVAAMTMLIIRGGKDPAAVWRYVASGVFGKEALTGGTDMVAWGLAFHFFIALSFAAFFFLIYPQLHRYISRPVAIGLLYGILIWLVMNRIVLPLSKAPAQPFDPARAAIGMVIIMVMVGLPISLIVSRHYSGR